MEDVPQLASCRNLSCDQTSRQSEEKEEKCPLHEDPSDHLSTLEEGKATQVEDIARPSVIVGVVR
jgi:hypothetical protein